MAPYRAYDYAKWAAEEFDWEIDPELIRLDVDSMPEEPEFGAQRDLDKELAAQMSDVFLPCVAAGVIVVELPDGRRVFVDGQHRWKAAKDAGRKWIWVLLYHMSYEQASAFFELKNGEAVRLTSHMDSTLAKGESGHAPTKTLIGIVEKHGCFLDRKRRHVQGAIGTSKMARNIYAVDDGQLLDQTLDLITDCWGRGPVALSAEVMEGVALFLAHWGSQFDPQRWRELRQRFRDEKLDFLVRDALRQWNEYRTVASKAAYIEAHLMYTFNYKRSGHRLPERTPGQLAKEPNLRQLARQHRQARIVT